MKLARKPKRSLADFDAQLQGARAELAATELALDQARTTAEATGRDLGEQLADGVLDSAGYELAKGAHDEAVIALERTCQRQRVVCESLAQRAAKLARQEAAAQVAAEQAEVDRTAAAITETETLLASLRADHVKAEDRLALVRHETRHAASPYDLEAAKRADSNAREEASQVEWYAKSATTVERWPIHLRARIVARRKEMGREQAEYRRRVREGGAESLRRAGISEAEARAMNGLARPDRGDGEPDDRLSVADRERRERRSRG